MRRSADALLVSSSCSIFCSSTKNYKRAFINSGDGGKNKILWSWVIDIYKCVHMDMLKTQAATFKFTCKTSLLSRFLGKVIVTWQRNNRDRQINSFETQSDLFQITNVNQVIWISGFDLDLMRLWFVVLLTVYMHYEVALEKLKIRLGLNNIRLNMCLPFNFPRTLLAVFLISAISSSNSSLVSAKINRNLKIQTVFLIFNFKLLSVSSYKLHDGY